MGAALVTGVITLEDRKTTSGITEAFLVEKQIPDSSAEKQFYTHTCVSFMFCYRILDYVFYRETRKTWKIEYHGIWCF